MLGVDKPRAKLKFSSFEVLDSGKTLTRLAICLILEDEELCFFTSIIIIDK